MKTILSSNLRKFILRIGGTATAVVLALSIIGGALPQPVLAAGSSTVACADQYIVKNKDTRSSIASSYDLKWWQIAAANHLALGAPLSVGSTLCIPTEKSAASTLPGTMTATAIGKALTVKMADFNQRGIWNVKVKDASNPVAEYFKLGRIAVPQNGSVTGLFYLPKDLHDTARLEVCVTNAETSKPICTFVNHVM